MAKYYRVAMQMSGFNDMLLQHFDEVIIKCKQPQTIVPVNNRFQIHNNFLEVTSDDVFKKTPFALMELFVLLAQNREIQGLEPPRHD